MARALAETQGEIVNDAWRFYLDDADAAIATIRGETLEEAAREIENNCHDDMTRAEEAAAIRALKDKP